MTNEYKNRLIESLNEMNKIVRENSKDLKNLNEQQERYDLLFNFIEERL